ncbi:hypothetical protein E2562_002446 [Oryza meyeriana var. granulata]|uniref:Uncharacterized protein n=1 Tax=Oryza meyeriana var. granulata TaxID=110450 RepID=A0A6G1F2L3_9ORYZ|nr:hypothetical protein E2562_002446 [Oryza meyeriana var. granulata]
MTPDSALPKAHKTVGKRGAQIAAAGRARPPKHASAHAGANRWASPSRGESGGAAARAGGILLVGRDAFSNNGKLACI